ncbi:MAG: rRNA maturation RNase YbeY [Eubacterium sp.]|nr:rRNA maturation RNase YbeY [Eubacterium sp.]MDY5497731.1 rRNA maturation RNase YbeY [Anaerobutyricum sp.]
MTFEIENNYPEQVVPDFEEVINKVIEAALDYEKCPYEAQVYVLLTDNGEIHEINREHRHIDRPTDVLSFPMAEYPVPGNFSDIEQRDPDTFHPETGELILGDIIISMDKVKEQAETYGHSPKRELAFLVAHSMLHLMGYDHMVDEERLVMERKQEDILTICGYLREIKN